MDGADVVIGELIASYGALGAVAVYLAVRDYKLNKTMIAVLNEIVVAVKLLTAKIDGNISK